MNKNNMGLKIAAGCVAAGALGLLFLNVRDFLHPKPLEAELRENQAILHNVFQKNKDLEGQLQTLTQTHTDSLMKLEAKDKEIAGLQEQLVKQVDLVKKVTVSNQSLLQTEKQTKDKVKFSGHRDDYIPVRKETEKPLYESQAQGWRRIFENAAKPHSAIEIVTSLAAPMERGADLAASFMTPPQTAEYEDLLPPPLPETMKADEKEKQYREQIARLENQIQALQHEVMDKRIEKSSRPQLTKAIGTASSQSKIKLPMTKPRVIKAAFPVQTAAMKTEKENLLNEIKALQAGRQKDKATYYYNLGVAYSRAGIYEEASHMYEKNLEIDPKDAASHYNLGILYDEYLHQADKAEEHYKQYLILSSDEEKKRIVADWIKLARYNGRDDGDGRIESGKKAVENLLFTKSN